MLGSSGFTIYMHMVVRLQPRSEQFYRTWKPDERV